MKPLNMKRGFAAAGITVAAMSLFAMATGSIYVFSLATGALLVVPTVILWAIPATFVGYAVALRG